jgi:hypothetical protein
MCKDDNDVNTEGFNLNLLIVDDYIGASQD